MTSEVYRNLSAPFQSSYNLERISHRFAMTEPQILLIERNAHVFLFGTCLLNGTFQNNKNHILIDKCFIYSRVMLLEDLLDIRQRPKKTESKQTRGAVSQVSKPKPTVIQHTKLSYY